MQLAAAIAPASQFWNGARAPYDPANVAAIINRANINAGRQTIRGIDAQLAYRTGLAELPQVFNRVEFGAAGRQRHQGNIGRHDQLG